MKNFIITTDTTSDLPADYVDAHQLGMLSLTYTLGGDTYSWERPLPVKDFYNRMREALSLQPRRPTLRRLHFFLSALSASRMPIFSTLPFPPASVAATTVAVSPRKS